MIELEVFPNTGHHFFHVPLKSLAPRKTEEELTRYAHRNRGPWEPWSEFSPWLLYQYSIETSPYTGEETPVIKIAVESNLGLPDRGLLFGVESFSFADPARDAAEQAAQKRARAYEEARAADAIVPPYASFDKAKLWEDYPTKRLFLDELSPHLPQRRRGGGDGSTPEPILLPPGQLAVHWKRPGGADPVDVDLIVDLGNTRTVALLLENPGQEGIPFGRRVKVLRFIPRGCPFTPSHTLPEPGKANDDYAIIDSWLVLHRPIFASREPPFSEEKVFEHWQKEVGTNGSSALRLQHLPQTFVELSPALIGGGKAAEGAARTLSQVRLDTDARFYLSSPKRYAWDEEPVGRRGGTYWKQIPNDTDPGIPDAFDDLRGLFRYYMDPGGVDWDWANQPTREDFRGKPMVDSPPEYPRRDAICWFALSILECAYRQINSAGYLATVGRESLPRQLRQVRVTYPSGWTWEEQSRYLAQWRRAVDLFALTHLADPRPVDLAGGGCGQKPVLAERSLDEAVCSQLPVLYADISFLGGDGLNWFETYGRQRSVVVMNIDVGGGTTDVSIIRYHLNRPDGDLNGRIGHKGMTAISSTLLFRDGNSIAGDVLVKRIVEKVLLPAWLRAGGLEKFEDNPAARRALLTLLKTPATEAIAQVDPKAVTRLVAVVRLVFIPLVNQWLQQLTIAENYPDSPRRPLVVRDIVHPRCLNELNALALKVIVAKCDRWGEEANLMRLRDAGNFEEWTKALIARDEVPFPMEARLQADPAALESCVDDVFESMFASLGLVAARERCDLAIVSGKTSELPRMRKLLVRNLPVLPQRIIPMRNFPAGGWYPFVGDDGIRINDAKTCTVAGAALYQDILNGNLEGFSIEQGSAGHIQKYFWGLVGRGSGPEEFYRSDNLLFRPSDYGSARSLDGVPGTVALERDFDLPLNCRIGRQIKQVANVRPEPVYRLAWTPPEQHDNRPVFARVRLRWTATVGGGERLELISVTPLSGQPVAVQPEHVRLRLNTMLDESFWLDEPRFDVDGLFNP
ncbi:MAG: virulence factor SrfB [Opitutaceae bacterium]|jgi:hypothetical protein